MPVLSLSKWLANQHKIAGKARSYIVQNKSFAL
jgi:hypothetical protein